MTTHQLSLLHMVATGRLSTEHVPKYLLAEFQALCVAGFLVASGASWALTASGKVAVRCDDAHFENAFE
jgi:hypothetical protein